MAEPVFSPAQNPVSDRTRQKKHTKYDAVMGPVIFLLRERIKALNSKQEMKLQFNVHCASIL